jgi:hypothetical protein
MRSSIPKVWLAVTLIAIGVPARAIACSQCLCGTPFPADVLGGVVPLQLTYGLEERYLSKSNGLEDESGEERQNEHRVAGFAIWRPIDRLALLGRLPYNFKEIVTQPEGAASSAERARGFGDAELLALVGLQNIAGPRMTLGLVLGVTAPTGSSELEDDQGERLEAHLQPGTGAWSGTTGLDAAWAAGSGTVTLGILGRLNGENSHGYHYGDALLYNAGFVSRPWRRVQGLIQINGRSAERDRETPDVFDENSGGTVTYAAPGLRWDTGIGLAAEGQVQIPFQQSLHGEQTEHATARLMLSVIP